MESEGEIEESYALLKSDFRNFLYVCYKHLNLEIDHFTYQIAGFLQELHEDRDNGMIQALRAIGKSYVTSCFCCWVLWNDRDEKILVVSAAVEKALEFIAMTQNLIMELDILKELRPNMQRGFDTKRQRWSATQFDVYGCRIAQAPSVRAASIDSNLTGKRATILIPDDIESAKNSKTIKQREKIKEAVKEFKAIGLPGAVTFWLCTPQTEESVYKDLSKHLRLRVWPARYPTLEEIPAKYPYLAPEVLAELEEDPTLAGKPTVPERYTEDDLLEREVENGKSWFQLHYMLDCSLSDQDRYPLKLKDLIVTTVDRQKAPVYISWSRSNDIPTLESVGFSGDTFVSPQKVDDDWVNYTTTIMAIDPSGLGPDETGLCILSELHGNIYCHKLEGLSGNYESNMETIVNLIKEYNVKICFYESNFGDNMFGELLKSKLLMAKREKKNGVLQPRTMCSIESERFTSVQGFKEHRIISILEPIFNQHRLIMDEGTIIDNLNNSRGNVFDAFYQITRMTKERGSLRHDDRVDVLALGVYYFTDFMARNQPEIAAKAKDELF